MKNTQKTHFRISAKHLYLTYSQVHKSIESEEVLAELKKKPFAFFNYLIAKEYHQDGGTHLHALLIAKKKFSIRKHDSLDIQSQGNTYHGNYQPARSIKHIVEYICKEGDYITDLTNIRDGRLMTPKEILIQDVKHKGVSQALIDHCENAPNQALGNVSLVTANRYFQQLQLLTQSQLLDQVHTPFKLNDFNLNEGLKTWIEKPEKTLMLVGASGIGKTVFAKAFAKHKGFKTLFVNHKEDFKRINETYDCIIIDDANLRQLNETELLAIIDTQVNKTLRVLYTTVSKKPKTVQIIIMNYKEFYELLPVLQQKRFARRLHLEQIQLPFIINLNVQINNITNLNIDLPQGQINMQTQTLPLGQSQIQEEQQYNKNLVTIREIQKHIASKGF